MTKARPVHSKPCKACGVIKPLTEFYPFSGKPGLHLSYCKPCHNASAQRSFRNLPAQAQATAQRRNKLSRAYGITLERYQEMLLAQGRKCAICGTFEPGGKPNRFGVSSFQVDHDHHTGRLRGLLCTRCNIGIGGLKDSIELLEAAVAYLGRYK